MYSKIRLKLKLVFLLSCSFVIIISFQNCVPGDKANISGSTVTEQELASTKALTILTTKCSSCHDAVLKAGGVDVLNVNELLVRGVIVPNEPTLSVLYTHILSGHPSTSKALGQSEITAIYQWILTGFSSNPVVTPLPPPVIIPLAGNYKSIFNNILRPKCMSCHNALTLAGGHDYSSYATTTVVANGVIVKGSPLASKMYIATRDKIMPKVGAPLNDAETKAIYDWILAGALDN